MPLYYSNHCALVAVIYAEGGGELKWYQKRTQLFPLSLPRGPKAQLDAAYKELQQDVVCPPPRESPAKSWITAKTWKVVNYRALLHRKGMPTQATARKLGQDVRACLKADCLLRAKNTASDVKGCLAAGEFIEAWHHLKGWYRSAEDRAPKPCPKMMAKQTRERVQLYAACTPPGLPLPIRVNPALVNDAAPMEAELRMVVGEL
jgi:hypothetical protein